MAHPDVSLCSKLRLFFSTEIKVNIKFAFCYFHIHSIWKRTVVSYNEGGCRRCVKGEGAVFEEGVG